MLTYKVGNMNKCFLILSLLISLTAGAQNTPQLRPGDVLLQPLKCWACALIEAEEDSIYSHMGVVLTVTPEILVAEALGTVKKVTLKEFLAKTELGQKTKLLRFRNDQLTALFQANSRLFLKMFNDEFEGATYDSEFLWNNLDLAGKEKLYCSEMISKLFQYFVGIETPIKQMHFRKNREHWLAYFQGNIPDDRWGNSPADFDRSELFYSVGEL